MADPGREQSTGAETCDMDDNKVYTDVDEPSEPVRSLWYVYDSTNENPIIAKPEEYRAWDMWCFINRRSDLMMKYFPRDICVGGDLLFVAEGYTFEAIAAALNGASDPCQQITTGWVCQQIAIAYIQHKPECFDRLDKFHQLCEYAAPLHDAARHGTSFTTPVQDFEHYTIALVFQYLVAIGEWLIETPGLG